MIVLRTVVRSDEKWTRLECVKMNFRRQDNDKKSNLKQDE